VSYLLDTNVVSELVRARPDPQVVDWVRRTSDYGLYLSVLSIGELRKGVERLPVGERRERLVHWVEWALPAWFGSRLLPIDLRIAERWGRTCASNPRALPAIDTLLAATALAHDLAMVTRNVADFEVPGLRVIDPWTSP